jgi:hypothetical protein
VTFSFADPAAGLYGLARLGLAGADGERDASALAVLFSGREPVAAIAHGGVRVASDASFEDLALPGLTTTIEEPLREWSLRFDDGPHGFELTFEAAGPPAEVEMTEPTARAGGMTGYEQLCHVHGTVRAGGRAHELRGLGQRGRAWGEPDWERIDSTRVLAAWLDDGTGIALCAVRPAGASDHEEEATWAALLGAAGTLRVDEPRLSTTYDDSGRQRRAGLELWVGEEDSYPRRAAGEVVCGSTLDLGQLRLDCAFVRWRMDGRTGVGRYDVLRRA